MKNTTECNERGAEKPQRQSWSCIERRLCWVSAHKRPIDLHLILHNRAESRQNRNKNTHTMFGKYNNPRKSSRRRGESSAFSSCPSEAASAIFPAIGVVDVRSKSITFISNRAHCIFVTHCKEALPFCHSKPPRWVRFPFDLSTHSYF